MPNELRPCVFLFGGDQHKGLFHCWSVYTKNYLSHTKNGQMVALVENKNGIIFEVDSDNIYFLDTRIQMEKFEDYFGGDDNV